MKPQMEDILRENAQLREELRVLRQRARPGDEQPVSSDQMYKSIFRLSPSFITVTRFEDGRYYDVNDAFCRALNITREAAIGTTSVRLNLWVDPALRERLKRLLERNGSFSNIEIPYRAGDTVVDVLQSAELVTIGECRYIIGVTTDITEHKKAQRALGRERERLSVTLQSLADGVVAVDGDALVETVNRAAAQLLGVSELQAVGKRLDQVLVLRDAKTNKRLSEPLLAVLQRQATAGEDQHFLLAAGDGGERTVAINHAPLVTALGGVAGSVLVLRDVTVQLQMEEQLRKASRLESLGILAGGIAHDFNNLLMGIQSNLTFVRGASCTDSERTEALEDVDIALRHAHALTRKLLTFSQGGAPVTERVSIPELLAEVPSVALRGSSLRYLISVDEDVGEADVDRSQIMQAIENLVLNAGQAMPEGGTLRILARNVEVTERDYVPLARGRYMLLSFEDNGPGISQVDLSRIFDPFFSKRPGGTGLGLSIVHSIVTRHGGWIDVRSVPGEGARFDLYLPAGGETLQRPAPSPRATGAGTGRVLFMDDDASVGRAARRLLGQMGYAVDLVVDGMGAVQALEEAVSEGDSYAVVFLDLKVPGGAGGIETVQKLRAIDPRARFVASTGYSDDPVMANPEAYGFDAGLAKPHGAEELAHLLSQLLSTAPQ